MPRPFVDLPAGPSYALRNVRLVDPAGLASSDLLIEHGRIAAIAPPSTLPPGAGPDLGGAMVWPGLIDAHGVTAIRTHLDSLAPQAAISWPVFRSVRDEWAGRIALQATSLMSVEYFLTDQGPALADLVARSGGNLGFGTRLAGPGPVPPEFDAALDRAFALAEARGLDLDLHVDESGDLGARALIRIARTALRRGFPGRILCGHCCSLAVQPPEFVAETLAACAQAGIDVVTLPSVNLYLQDRHAGRTPRWRGVTVLHEMRAAGLRVAIAGDNVRDPFYAYGDHDVLETFSHAVKILHLDHPFADWPAAVTATPAAIMGLPEHGTIRAGAPADLVVLKARSYGEMLSRNQSDRLVIRAGQPIDTTPPDYALLDQSVVTPGSTRGPRSNNPTVDPAER